MSSVRKTDTSPTAAEVQAGVLRGLLPGRRLELAVEMSLMSRLLLCARLRREHPDWPESALTDELLRLMLPDTVLPPRRHDRS